jgi:hypothetical protein
MPQLVADRTDQITKPAQDTKPILMPQLVTDITDQITKPAHPAQPELKGSPKIDGKSFWRKSSSQEVGTRNQCTGSRPVVS